MSKRKEWKKESSPSNWQCKDTGEGETLLLTKQLRALTCYCYRDKQMESHIQDKLQEAQRSLKQLHDKETRIQTKLSQNKNKQKLAIF